MAEGRGGLKEMAEHPMKGGMDGSKTETRRATSQRRHAAEQRTDAGQPLPVPGDAKWTLQTSWWAQHGRQSIRAKEEQNNYRILLKNCRELMASISNADAQSEKTKRTRCDG